MRFRSGRGVGSAFAWISRGTAVFLLALPFLLWLHSLPALKQHSFFSLLFQSWSPASGQPGVFPFLISSLSVAFGALLPALLMGFSLAILIDMHGGYSRFFRFLEKVLRAMAGIPTVIYGFSGVFILVPWMRLLTPASTGLSLCTASLMLAMLILPTFSLYALQSFRSVSRAERQTVFSLGANPFSFRIFYLIPRCRGALLSAGFFTLARAFSDTLIALMLSGNALALPESFFDSGRTLTAHAALILPGDFDGPELSAVFLSILVFFSCVSLLSFLGLKKRISS